jgi:hypothetical protein
MPQLEQNRRTLQEDVPAFFCAGAEGAQVSRRSRVGPGKVGARASALVLVIIGVPLTLGIMAAFAAAPAPSFGPTRTYKTGSEPGSIALGDLNADRALDLATANANGNTVSLLLNRGDGSFRPKRQLHTGGFPESIAIADLNGDAKPDVATANGVAKTVSVFLNTGDASFQPRLDYSTGGHPFSVVLGDLNGDHTPDLATANGDANTPCPC